MQNKIAVITIALFFCSPLFALENKIAYMQSQRQMTPEIGAALTLTDMYFSLNCQKQISLQKLKELQATPQFNKLTNEVRRRGTLGLSAASNEFGKNIECD